MILISRNSSYKKSQWKEFRESIIESDGYRCVHCERSGDNVTLQVHHTKYRGIDKKSWEYAPKDCITLCKGCHAREHGIIQPKIGWKYMGSEDLGDLIGTCENAKCGTSIRHVYHVFHQSWGTLQVGTHCCDNLTDTKIASNQKESQNRYERRKKRFIDSVRWKYESDSFHIKQARFDIEVIPQSGSYGLKIHGLLSKKVHENLNEAKLTAFEVIESGKLLAYLEEHDIALP